MEQGAIKGNMPLDGMLRQHGEVWMRVQNKATAEVNVSMGKPSFHSSCKIVLMIQSRSCHCLPPLFRETLLTRMHHPS
jgi:hypothetical protein